jgi:succinate-semialdehyde dehydrogenase/glutarate-semialdehyde dehydrogenase
MNTIKNEKHPEFIESRNPASGEFLGKVEQSTSSDVKEKAAQARLAQEEWVSFSVDKRNHILNNLIQVMIHRADEIARIVSSENGKPPVEALGMLLPISGNIKLHIKMAKKLENGVKVSPSFFFGSKARIYYEPLGLIGFILPWNFPFESGIKHMIPALASGNAVLQKPSPIQPMIGELIQHLFEDAGTPKGLVQMVHGYAETGKAVIDHSDAICFIGSTQIGKEVGIQAAQGLIPSVLELGGNDAAIVRHDADIDFTAQGIVNGACFNAGQVCNGIERIYVNHSIAETFTQYLLKWVKKLIIGNDQKSSYHMGPMTWAPQEEIYKRHVADALNKGAKLIHGGTAIEKGNGRYWPPTILTHVNHDMLIMQEETFGPFLPVMTFKNDEEALSLANDSKYGLAGSIWTADIDTAYRMMRQLKVGHVMINNAVQSGGCATLPFGGERDSGVGRLSGEQAFFNWVSQKSVMASPKMAKELWMPYKQGSDKVSMGLVKAIYGDSIRNRFTGIWEFLKNR